ncbi:MAG: hypothetical protein PHD30_07830, partial [Paludibacter sp.]|nr:hypothetical protein [Paludibacter sp.]
MATFEELIQQLIDHSNLIGTETKIGQNTNIRVGNLGHKVVELLSHIGNVNEKFLSRLTQDRAAALIKFLAGAEFGEFIPGMFGGKGAKIDNLGNMEATSLRLRALLEV